MSEEGIALKSHYHQTLAAGGLVLREWNIASGQVDLAGAIEAVRGLRPGKLDAGWKSWMEFVYPDDHSQLNEVINRNLPLGGNYQLEYRLRGDSKPIWVREEGVVFHDVRRAPSEILAVVREISEIQDLENRLGHARKMEAFGQLAGGVAHDFNNMLAVILGYAQLVLHDFKADDPRLPYVQEIESAARRASSLTNQLLAFTRQEVQGTVILKMDEVLSEIGKMLGRLIGEQVKLVLNPGTGEEGKVRADRNQIEQLLIHLTLCARNLLPEGGFLTFHTRLAEPEMGSSGARRFLLAAECRALSPVDREHPSPGEVVVWNGDLDALETCASIVKESQGTLSPGGYRNLPGALAIFFPLGSPVPTAAAMWGTTSGAPALSTGPVGPGTILLVEDDKGLRNLGRVVLSRMGYQVLEAENGVAGLKAFDNAPPGEIILTITDMVMPAMGGREMAEQIFARNPELPVLLISGYPEQFQQVLRGKLPPAHAFLRKPFPMGELSVKVRELLGQAALPSLAGKS